MTDDIVDSPVAWVAEHIRRYADTDGRDGGELHGNDILLLTTRGRRTGTRRRTALIYGRDGDRHLLVASDGGSPRHPAWYLNLAADPAVELQVGADRFAGTARTASGAERDRLWRLMAERFPRYDAYQEVAGREIPLVVVERA
ncbi:nitroreductase family deazaflavin-dependent oxidoreductase [Longispora sp. NPDC051575]|uniref:nitroreductase family deazaflavin-dependent oxidoreductase n=1 Tax=Longispora sp. NPDC051575 TaxID=3154943 RepID=UPI003431C39A